VGYAGGTSANPTYYNIGDHSETIQIAFDPTRITYEKLLAEFWNSHDADYRSPSRQYMAILHYANDAQRDAARASARRIGSETGRPVLTEIRPAGTFHMAEDYHQKYYLRSSPSWLSAVQTAYSDPGAFRDSTLAARINGCLGGYCTREALSSEIDSYGLSADSELALLGLARDE
jgi:peptide-methionine (S)-S-oxide reductase